MTSEDLPIRQTKNLRRRAVERVAEQIRTAVSRSGTDTRRLIQELEGYHIELELQLEQLRQNMAELELDYDELYESAPVGYFTLRRHGEIEETNPAGVRMLGQPRAWLVNQQFADFLTSESLLSFNEFLGRVTGGTTKKAAW